MASDERGAEPERAADAVDEHRLAGHRVGFLHRAIRRAEIAEAGGLLERHVVGKLDQRVLRRGHELAEAAVGIEIVDFLRVRPETEIAVEGEVAAAGALTGATRLAGAAGAQWLT